MIIFRREHWAQSVDRALVGFGLYREAEYRKDYWGVMAAYIGYYSMFMCDTRANAAMQIEGEPSQLYKGSQSRNRSMYAGSRCARIQCRNRRGAFLYSAPNFEIRRSEICVQDSIGGRILSLPVRINRAVDL